MKILFLADTHLGFDLPLRPRIQRRRRGAEFFANYQKALEPALRGEVDIVIHGGDLFYRSRIPQELITRAFDPLLKVADRGVPVLLTPGNHERSIIPQSLFETHHNIHVYHRPTTLYFTFNGIRYSFSGIPFIRHNIRELFPSLVRELVSRREKGDRHFLCLHQVVEGAKVGFHNYTFRSGSDVIPGVAIPVDFDGVLTGHVHRHQILTKDLSGNPLKSPVIYAGSIERTSMAERAEEKGYLILSVETDIEVCFEPLPTRPMFAASIDCSHLNADELEVKIRQIIAGMDPEGILRIKLTGEIKSEARGVLRSDYIRAIAPGTTNVDFVYARETQRAFR